MNKIQDMTTYKIVFESGVTDTVEAESIEVNDVLDKVLVRGSDSNEGKKCISILNTFRALSHKTKCSTDGPLYCSFPIRK